jgi:hypothetical protein
LPLRNSDPAWLQDYFLGTGRSETTVNATFTFVKRKGQVYAVTCGHVVSALRDPALTPGALYPTLAIGMDWGVINLSHFAEEGQLTPALVKLEEKNGIAPVDIAFARIDSSWPLIAKKDKAPIDLDAWRQPDWTKVRFCVAAGYPNNGKRRVVKGGVDRTSVKFFQVVAELASSPLGTAPTFALSSKLEAPHNHFFSGMSGGPVYAVAERQSASVDETDLLPAGIVFQGYPAKPDPPGTQGTETPFLTDSDIFFRVLSLTPDSFDEWVRLSGAG